MPEKDPKDKSKEPPLSRRKALGDDAEPEMPECEALYLVDYLFEIGPTQTSGMGNSPISHSEIEAWQRNTGIELDAWQARTLRSLSLAYLVESQAATKPDCPPPYQPNLQPQDQADVSKKVKNAFQLLMNTRPKNASRNP